jgi:hypothetical protein
MQRRWRTLVWRVRVQRVCRIRTAAGSQVSTPHLHRCYTHGTADAGLRTMRIRPTLVPARASCRRRRAPSFARGTQVSRHRSPLLNGRSRPPPWMSSWAGAVSHMSKGERTPSGAGRGWSFAWLSGSLTVPHARLCWSFEAATRSGAMAASVHRGKAGVANLVSANSKTSTCSAYV